MGNKRSDHEIVSSKEYCSRKKKESGWLILRLKKKESGNVIVYVKSRMKTKKVNEWKRQQQFKCTHFQRFELMRMKTITWTRWWKNTTQTKNETSFLEGCRLSLSIKRVWLLFRFLTFFLQETTDGDDGGKEEIGEEERPEKQKRLAVEWKVALSYSFHSPSIGAASKWQPFQIL